MNKNLELPVYKAIAVALALGVFSFMGGWLVNQTYPSLLSGQSSELELGELRRIYALLQKNYDGELDKSKLEEGAKAGFVAAAGDPYTTYLNAQAAKQLNDDLTGTLSGIGAEIGIKNEQLQVVAPIEGSPADKAGLQPGDRIQLINGEDTSGLSLDEAVTKIRGEKGTQVKLSISRRGGQPFEVSITRDMIVVKSVEWKIQEPGIGYIKLSRFGTDTVELMEQAAVELKRQGAGKIILDLRNNPGGYLDGAVKVASQFVSNKLVVTEKKGKRVVDELYSTSGGQLVGMPSVLLINNGSASASEIVAGALQDHGTAIVVGETSFGKGSVQEIKNLSRGAQLKITIAHWFTPKGRNISKEGIKPDVSVELSQDDYDNNRDPQLEKALERLR